jgi:hypothetical protein
VYGLQRAPIRYQDRTARVALRYRVEGRAQRGLSGAIRGTTMQNRGEMHRFVSDVVFRALRDEPGFVGALNLVDPDSGDAVMIVLWHSAEHARGSAPGDQEHVSVWEVTVRV